MTVLALPARHPVRVGLILQPAGRPAGGLDTFGAGTFDFLSHSPGADAVSSRGNGPYLTSTALQGGKVTVP